MSTETHNKLNAAIQEHFSDEFEDNAAIVTHWTVVGAGMDLAGDPRIMGENSHEDMPTWQVRGLLSEGIVQLASED